MKKLIYLLIASVVLSCGERAEQIPPEASHEIPVTDDSPRELLEVSVRAYGNTMDALAFEPSVIDVPHNARIRITLRNESSAEGMYHNMAVIKMGSGEEVSKKAIEAGPDKNYLPEDAGIIAASPMLAPLETGQFEFDAPAIGSWHFICTFPGHYPQMTGRLNVVEIIQ
jgi:azurin